MAKKKETEVLEKVEDKKIEVIKEVKKDVVEKKGGRLSRKQSNSTFANLDKLDKERIVPVLNMTSGAVGYNCKLTPQTLVWRAFGDEQNMSIGELLIMNAQNKRMISEVWLMVDDEEFAETLSLTKDYELLFEVEDLNQFYSQRVHTIKEKLSRFPLKAKKDLINRTVLAINSGELQNLAIVRLLREEFGVDIKI